MKKIWIITLFPEYFEPLKNCGVVGQLLRGERGEKTIAIEALNLRDFAQNKYGSVDDYGYGGGQGMVMTPGPLAAAIKSIGPKENLHIVAPMPRGQVWNHQVAQEFCAKRILGDKDLVFICGRYEGIDERFLEKYVDEFISIGDYIISGGEVAVLSILDSALRFVEGTLNASDGAIAESFENSRLEHPHYTRPAEFEGMKVPSELTSGHHKKIAEFQKSEAERLTRKYRPDLLEDRS